MRDVRPILRFVILACCLGLATAGFVSSRTADAAPDLAAGPGVAVADAIKARYRRPADIPFPEDNPFSTEKAALGRALFFDASLSADGTLACATCHRPDRNWSDGLPRAIGRGGVALSRRTPATIDLAWSAAVLWDGRMDDLETQAIDPIRLPKIGNRSPAELAAALQQTGVYASAVIAAFGDAAITPARIAAALATFERTLVSPRSAFDAWIEGDEAAVGEDAKRGFLLFNGTAGCASCHAGWRFTDDGFHDIGLPDEADAGRGQFLPREPTLQHAFKTPTLRSTGGGVALIGPFMHDGSITTLDDVLTHYASGFVRRASLDPAIRAVALSAADRRDLTAFLASINARAAGS